MSAFDDMTAAADAAVVATFADKATVTPRSKTRYSGHIDDGAARDVCGVFSLTAGTTVAFDSGVGPAVNVAGHAAEFWVPAAKLPAVAPKNGDQLTHDGVTYKIADIDQTDQGDMNLILTLED